MLTTTARIFNKIPLLDSRKSREFHDFSLEELDQYAGALYTVSVWLQLSPEKFCLNRIDRTFDYSVKVVPNNIKNFGLTYTVYFLWFESFLEYLFSVKGKEDKFWSLFQIENEKDINVECDRINTVSHGLCYFLTQSFLSGIIKRYPIVMDKILNFLKDNKLDVKGWTHDLQDR